MNAQQALMVVVVLAVVAGLFRAYNWLRDGGMYYRQHPGAKLMDDMAKAGALSEPALNEIIQCVGSATDQRATVAEIRRERGLN